MQGIMPVYLFALPSIAYFVCLLTACSVGYKQNSNSTDEISRTAIVAAYRPEIEALLEKIEIFEYSEITSIEEDRGVTYYLGHYRKEPIVLFATGISIGNAAMTTQMALDRYNVSRLLFSGIAGGVNEKWKTGDVIIPERWSYHDESVYSNPAHDGDGYILADYYEAILDRNLEQAEIDPHVPRYENFGMIFPDTVSVSLPDGNGPQRFPYFTASRELLNVAEKTIAEIPPLPVTDSRTAQLSVGGHGVTGSVFLDNAEYRKWVREVWNAEVTEMESATIAQVCLVNDVPWVIIRAVSDLAGGQEGKNEENIYDRVASRNAAIVLFSILDELAVNEQ